MPKVTFVSEVLTVDAGAGQTVREVAQANGIVLERGLWTWAHCRGMGLCGACAVWVKPLAPGAVSKKGLLERLHMGLQGSVRLGCCAKITGDCEIRTKPGGPPLQQTTEWAPDPRPSRWKDRLNAKETGEEAEAGAPATKKAAAAPR